MSEKSLECPLDREKNPDDPVVRILKWIAIKLRIISPEECAHLSKKHFCDYQNPENANLIPAIYEVRCCKIRTSVNEDLEIASNCEASHEGP